MHPELHHGAALCTTLLRLSVLTRGAVAEDGSASGNAEMLQLTELSWLCALGLALSGRGMCSVTAPLTVTQGRTPPEAASLEKNLL